MYPFRKPTDPFAPQGGSGGVTIHRTGPTGTALTVNLVQGGTVIIPIGSAIAGVGVPYDPYSQSGYGTVAIAGSQGVYNIDESVMAHVAMDNGNNDPPLVGVYTHTWPAAQGDGPDNVGRQNGQFIIVRTGPTSQSLTVNYAVQADDFSDYDYTGYVTIPQGESSATVNYVPPSDAYYGSGYTGSGYSNVTLRITSGEYDLAPGVWFSPMPVKDADVPKVSISDAIAGEGDDEVFTVTLSKTPLSDVVVPYWTTDLTAHASTNYTAASDSLVFLAGTNVLSQTITVHTDLDPDQLGGLVFRLNLGTPTGAQLLLDDGPNVYARGLIDQVKGFLEGNSLVLLGANDAIDFGATWPPSGTLKGSLKLVYDTTRLLLYDGTTEVPSGTTFTPTDLKYLKAKGLNPSASIGDANITLYYAAGVSPDLQLATIDITVVNVYFTSVAVTNNYRELPGLPLSPNIIHTSNNSENGGHAGDKYGTVGTNYSNYEWLPSPAFSPAPFAEGAGSSVQYVVKAVVTPSDIAFSIDGNDNGYLSFKSGSRNSSGAEQSIGMTSLVKLPNCVRDLQENPLAWTVTLYGGRQGFDREPLNLPWNSTGAEIFVTLGRPITQWSGDVLGTNDITYKRLKLVTQICDGGSDQYFAAGKIQKWLNGQPLPRLPTKGNDETVKEPAKADELWALAGDGGYCAQCCELAELEEMMLGQLGVPGEFRQLYATEELAARGGMLNQVRYRSFAYSSGKLAVTSWTAELWMNFSGEWNEGEGGVRVGNRFYTGLCTFVGVDHDGMTAEYHVLVQMAHHYNRGDADLFQRYFNYFTSDWLNTFFTSPYVPIPTAP